MRKKWVFVVLLLLLLAGGLVAFRYYNNRNEVTYNSTTMPEIYKEILAKSDPMKIYARNDEHIVIMEKKLNSDPSDKKLLFDLAAEYLFAGKTQQGIAIFEKLEKDSSFVSSSKIPAKDSKSSRYDSLEMFLALSYLRLGEETNCINNHNAQSCIFPISGGGIHLVKAPAMEAIRRYVDILKTNPKDFISVWCLNVAMQANGAVPDFVPREFIMDSSRLKAQNDIGQFRDVAMQAGVSNKGLAGGICADDFDNDGYTDILSSSIGLEAQIKFFKNNGDGTFSDRTAEAGLTGETEGLNIVQCDYNNDGNLDFMIMRGAWKGKNGRFPLSLLRNDGNAKFTDVTIDAGLLRFYPTQTAEWADYNLDGYTDVFIGSESGYPSQLFLNNRKGGFTDVSKESGIVIEKGFVKGASWGDYNNDNYPDLYVSEFGKPNHLFKNNGPGKNGGCTFTDVAMQAGVEKPVWSFPCWWFDYNQDGWQDLYVSAYKLNVSLNSCNEFLGLPMDSSLMPCLYRNNGDGTFTNVSDQNGISYETFTMGCNYGDIDNDGWPDFYLGIGAPDLRAIFPNRMFRNNEGKNFQDVTISSGTGQLQKGHAIAFADFDMDGDEDVYADFGGFYSGDVFENALYENPGHGNHWIYLRLKGTKSNSYGVGAMVKLTYADSGIIRNGFYRLSKGASFGGNPLMIQAGVGKCTTIQSVEITWPSLNEKQVFTNVSADREYLVKEGNDKLTDITPKPFRFTEAMHMMAGM